MLKTNRRFWPGEGVAHPYESFQPRYNLPIGELHGLSEVFLDFQEDNEGLLSQPYGCYVVHGENPFSNLARHVEGRVFEETFGNTAPIMEEAYGPFEWASVHFLVMDHQERLPAASMRIIQNSPAGLKSLEDLPYTDARTTQGDIITPEMVYKSYNIDPDECVDVATAAVARDHRMNGIPALLLYRTLYLTIAADQSDYSHIVAIMDIKAERALKKLQMPFRPILGSQPFSYLDTAADQKSDDKRSLSRAIISPTPDFYAHLSFWQDNYEKRADSLYNRSALDRPFKDVIEELTKNGYVQVDELEMTRRIYKNSAIQAARYKTLSRAMRALIRPEYDINEDNPLGLEKMLAPEILERGRKNIANHKAIAQ
jgi:hypothetical protein